MNNDRGNIFMSNDNNKKTDALQKLEVRQATAAAIAQKLQKSIGVIKRKRDLQRKILVGTYYLEQATQNGTVQELKNTMLSKLQKERDRILFEDY